MRSLPLYPETPLAYVEQWPPREVESGSCTRCSLHVQTEHSCHSADGEAGGLLVYGEGPTKEDDRAKRIFTGRSGDYVRRLVRQWYKGPVAFDNVIRCPTPPEVKGDKVKRDKAIAQAVAVCRQFSHQTIIETRPERVVVLGARAASGILGRSPLPLSVRDGYGWLWREGQPVPVFYLMHPVAALRNRYLQKWFEVDFKHALTRPIPERPPWHALARIIATSEDAQTAARQLSRAPWVALDCETFGRPYSAGFRVTSVAVCAAGSDSPFVWPYEALQDQGCRDALQAVLDSTENVCQNGKFDSQALRQGLGVDMPPHKIDTRLVCKLLDPDAASALAVQAELVGMGGHKEENAGYLKTAKLELMRWARLQADEDATVDEMLADAWMRRARAEVKAKRDEARDLGEPLPSYKGLKAPEPTWMAKPDWFTSEVRKLLLDGLRAEVYTYALVPEDVSLRYNGLDAVSTARLGTRYEDILQRDQRAARVWNTALQPASRAIETIERLGIAAATSTMQALSAYLALRINDVRGRLAEYKFNPDSAVQVAKLLFEDLKLPVVSLTDAGAASTDKGTLNALKGQHPVVEELLDWRRLNKLKGTYADGMVLHVQDDGRIHTSLNLDGARSGRLSSDSPNLQNAPGAGTDEGKLFRDCFTAAPGMTLVEGDFSQLELRVAACLSGDDEMRRVFASGVDFHMQVAKFIAPIVWRIKPEDVTAEHRRMTKAFVFGVLYGMSDGGIVARTGCTFDEAGSIRSAVMGKFRQLDRWVKQTVRLAYQQGGAYTWWAGQQFRWRALPDLGEQDEGRGANAENASFNGPVQGSANEFCLMSVVALVDWLEQTRFPANVVMTVHDSILCEVAPSRLDELVERMNTIMTGWPSNGVPLEVDFKTGPSWGSMEKIELPSKKLEQARKTA